MAEAARELLNNASYHRYGYQAWLTANSSAEHAKIQVHNDGPGVDPQRLASAWARKKNTLHQFETAGGAYRIDSSPAWAGTTVILQYPGTDARP
jgi:signal transduction histidine kinase